MVSTDVAARGLHINRLQYVVNYDFPLNLEQYCHRVGRTGRQGRDGEAYSLLSRNLSMLAADLIKLLEVTKYNRIDIKIYVLLYWLLCGMFTHS